MNRYAAHRRASARWGRLGLGPAFATIRRKSVKDRFEVGYLGTGGGRVVMGAGPTWEIAFARAGVR